jgi:hypothetical protein
MELQERLVALKNLKDAQPENCLKTVLKGLFETEDRYRTLRACTGEQMAAAVQAVATESGKSLPAVKEPTSTSARAEAAQLILEELADDPRFAARIDAWFQANRPVMLEPVTTALVLAGIIFVLSLDIEVAYEDGNGKKKIKIVVKKKPTSAKILEKFWKFF